MSRKRPSVNKSAPGLDSGLQPSRRGVCGEFLRRGIYRPGVYFRREQAADGLGHIESRGGTALYDAVVASADKLAADAKRPKQVLVLITDGEDNASTLNLEQTFAACSAFRSGDLHDWPAVGDEMSHAEVRHARRALEMLSTETGGIAFFPKSIENIDQIAAEVARDIRNQYTLGYRSTKPTTEPGFRRVQ